MPSSARCQLVGLPKCGRFAIIIKGHEELIHLKEIVEREALKRLAKAFDSDVRIRVVQLLLERDGRNLNELAGELEITGSAITQHIRLLEEAGVIKIETTSGKRGIQKQCFLQEAKFLIDLKREQAQRNAYEAEIPVGSYVRYAASAPCGLATPSGTIGQWDDARYFDDPQRIHAGILWLSRGFVEYRLPNYVQKGQRAVELQLTQEVCSEAPGFCENWPSVLHFSLNGLELATWRSPGDYGLKRGLYNPDWWLYGVNQHGMLKPLVINREGAFIDGQRAGDYTLDDLNIRPGSEMLYRISAPDSAPYTGGMTLFGRGFGNYNHGILMRMTFETA